MGRKFEILTLSIFVLQMGVEFGCAKGSAFQAAGSGLTATAVSDPSEAQTQRALIEQETGQEVLPLSVQQTATLHQDLTEKGLLPSTCQAHARTSKKDLFICRMVPIAVRLNSEVYRQRVELLRLDAILKKAQSLDRNESEWLQKLREEYQVSSDAPMTELLSRVDIVPMGLLLAQAADESFWGQSWPATKGFNFFGMHGLLDDPTCMRVPKNPKVCLIRFASAEKGVAGYIQYMNTAHYDFTANFRKARAAQRASGKPLDSLTLVQSIKGYSEVGSSYVVIIRRMLQQSDLEKYDGEDKVIESGAVAVH